ncbi:hypothetical protein [Cryobacterium sp. GrIS_2_6]|uniref:hypothetical protein n=1 Tax=Cryobacterium sp. GrIS_2_6 TaxID=3162785 RepID=UPI002E09D253|nr:hypothetical protein [Cryobacterium psychrotolerans]
MNTPEFPETPASGTTAPPSSADNRRAIIAWPALRTLAWHRPLLAATAAMAVLVVVCLVGLLIDPRSLTGAPVWAKPLKFSISVLVYAASLAWLLGILSARRRRLAWWIGTVSTIALVIEMVIIVGMHALQVIPRTALLLEVLASRLVALRAPVVRLRLIRLVIGLYLGVLAILTGQALAGESIVRPDALVTTLTIALVAAVALAATLVLSAASRAALPPTDAAAP